MGQIKFGDEKAPGAKAKSDNQGSSELCTSLSLAKAGTDALDDLKFDVSQHALTSLIVNQHKDTEARWASDFQNTQGFIQNTKTNEFWYMTFDIERCEFKEFKNDWNAKKGRFLAVYATTEGNHCVYAEKLKKVKNDGLYVVGLNSWGKVDENPEIKQVDVIRMYRVRVMLQKEENGVPKCKTPGFKRIKKEIPKDENKTTWYEDVVEYVGNVVEAIRTANQIQGEKKKKKKKYRF